MVSRLAALVLSNDIAVMMMMMMMMMMMVVVVVVMTGELEEAAELFTRYSQLSNDSKARVHAVDSCTLYR